MNENHQIQIIEKVLNIELEKKIRFKFSGFNHKPESPLSFFYGDRKINCFTILEYLYYKHFFGHCLLVCKSTNKSDYTKFNFPVFTMGIKIKYGIMCLSDEAQIQNILKFCESHGLFSSMSVDFDLLVLKCDANFSAIDYKGIHFLNCAVYFGFTPSEL